MEVPPGCHAVDCDTRLRIDVLLVPDDAPCVLGELREIPNITHRVVVLPRRVPDVELDIRETVIWVFEAAVPVYIGP